MKPNARKSATAPLTLLAVVIPAAGCNPNPPAAQAAPIPVSIVDDDHDPTLVTPYQWTVEFQNLPPGGSVTPSQSEELVIQFVSGFCNETSGVDVHNVRITGDIDHYFAPTATFDTGNDNGHSAFTHATRMYLNPGSSLQFMAFPTTAAATSTCRFSISGYLVAP